MILPLTANSVLRIPQSTERLRPFWQTMFVRTKKTRKKIRTGKLVMKGRSNVHERDTGQQDIPFIYRFESALDMIRQNSLDRLSSKDPFYNNQVYQVNVTLNMLNRPIDSNHNLIQGTFEFPHRTSDRMNVMVLCSEELIEAAIQAGASFAGDVTEKILIRKINGGKELKFVVSEKMWQEKKLDLEKFLKLYQMVPNCADRTLIGQDSDFVEELKKHVQGRYTKFSVTSAGLVHAKLGLEKHPPEWIVQNLHHVLQRLYAMKPSECKEDDYIQSIWLNVKFVGSFKLDVDRLLVSAGLATMRNAIEDEQHSQVSYHDVHSNLNDAAEEARLAS